MKKSIILLAALSVITLAGCGGGSSSSSSSSSTSSSTSQPEVKYVLPEMHVYKNMKFTYDSEEFKLVTHKVGVSYLQEVTFKAVGETPEKKYLACYVFDNASYKEYKTLDGVTVDTFKDASDWKSTGSTVNEDTAIGKKIITQDSGDKVYKKTESSDKIKFIIDSKEKEVTTTRYSQETTLPSNYYWYTDQSLFSLPVKVNYNSYIEVTSTISDIDTTITKLPGNVVFPS